MKVKFWTSLVLLAISAACASHDNTNEIQPDTLTIFAAASLTEVFTTLAQEFELSNPGTEVSINFAGSQQLAQQISQGASADVFASADEQQMENVIISGQVELGTDQPFAHNQLAIVLPGDNPAGVLEFKDLAMPGVKLILADKAVPAGSYAQELLARASAHPEYGSQFKDNVVENIVSYEENVRAVLTKVILGEADAGIVYVSDFIGARGENIKMVPVPDEVNVMASYYIASLRESTNKDRSEEFLKLVLSSEGQEILKMHGFNLQGQHE